MRRSLFVAALGLGLVGLASSPALALSSNGVTAHVPFAFSVRNESFPAGDYLIKPLDELSPQVLVIRSADGRHSAIVMATEAEPEARGAQPALVFDRYGKLEFLHAVELPEETGAMLRTSSAEIQAARSEGGR